jgi:hypothetical protein
LRAAFLAAFLLVAASPRAPAEAQGCLPRDQARVLLMERYREAPVAAGAAVASGRVVGYVEVWRSADGATWTITITYPDRRTCALLSGDDWRNVIWQAPEAGGAT